MLAGAAEEQTGHPPGGQTLRKYLNSHSAGSPWKTMPQSSSDALPWAVRIHRQSLGSTAVRCDSPTGADRMPVRQIPRGRHDVYRCRFERTILGDHRTDVTCSPVDPGVPLATLRQGRPDSEKLMNDGQELSTLSLSYEQPHDYIPLECDTTLLALRL